MHRRLKRTLSRKQMESFFSKGELQIIDKMEEMFRIHENTAYAGIVGCAIQFYRYNPAIEGGKSTISIHWTGDGWAGSGVGVKKHSRKVKVNNAPEDGTT